MWLAPIVQGVAISVTILHAAYWLPGIIHICPPTGSGGGVTGFPLVVDSVLSSSSSTPTLPVLATSVVDDFPIPPSGGSSKVVVEGMPPVHQATGKD